MSMYHHDNYGKGYLVRLQHMQTSREGISTRKTQKIDKKQATNKQDTDQNR